MAIWKKLGICLIALLSIMSAKRAVAQERIVSIGGDVTEIIYALKAEQQLVGRDSTSVLPKAANDLPDVGYMRQLNVEGILSLNPTQIITTEVAQPTVVFEQLASVGVKVDSIPFKYTAEGVLEKIKQISQLLNKPQQGVVLAEKFTQEIQEIPNSPLDVRILFVMNRAGANQTVAGKNTVADVVIQMAGAKNAVADQLRFVPISQEGVITADPDLIVMTKLGVEGLGSPEKIWALPGIAHTKAGKRKNIVVVDDLAIMSFGLTTPRAITTIREAAEKVAKQ